MHTISKYIVVYTTVIVMVLVPVLGINIFFFLLTTGVAMASRNEQQ